MEPKNAYIFTDQFLTKSLEWVAKALSKDESRFQLMNLRVEADCVVATDGKRLHRWDYELGIPEGCYSVLFQRIDAWDFHDEEPISMVDKIVLIESEFEYPIWRKVIPKHGKSINLKWEENMGSYISMKTNVCLNCDFLKDACGDKGVIVVRYGEPNQAILIEYADRQAMVMGIRTPEMKEAQ